MGLFISAKPLVSRGFLYAIAGARGSSPSRRPAWAYPLGAMSMRATQNSVFTSIVTLAE